MSELALQLIHEAKETRAKTLDLGNCGLTKLPDALLNWWTWKFCTSVLRNDTHVEGERTMEHVKLMQSSGVLRGVKRDLYEGGIHVPTIVWGLNMLFTDGKTIKKKIIKMLMP